MALTAAKSFCQVLRCFTSRTSLTNCGRIIQARNYAVLDDDGDIPGVRTTVTILNQEQESGIFFDAYSRHGFRLNSGIRIVGPCAVFPRSIMHWNVGGIRDVNENSLSLFTMLVPKIDLLVLGVGETSNLSQINPAVIQHLRSKKINVEVLTTDQALSTFNFLNAEKRYVAGALIPPAYIDMEQDSFESQITYSADTNLLTTDYHESTVNEKGELDELMKKSKPMTQLIQENLRKDRNKDKPGD